MGFLERGDQVRLAVIPNRRKGALQQQVRNHVAAGTALYIDAPQSYDGLAQEYAHEIIDHAQKYVDDGRVHTNGLENFWTLLKRGINGAYVSVEPFRLFRYLDEQAFRYNNRKADDAERVQHGVRQIVGRSVTYKNLTGAEA
jgi:ISXO2-like transposase domain